MDPEVRNTCTGAPEEEEKNLSPENVEEVEETVDNRANEKVESIEKDDGSKSEEVKEDEGPKMLDLAFAMDCTGSMGSYIYQARQNIKTICEEIVSQEKADIKLALVEYRDHPPQDLSFVTKVHEFTPAVADMKSWLDNCSAEGGGDGPEAVADALEEVRKLDWRPNATKICVFIADAPPHGLAPAGDGFPNGCPMGFDPMQVTQQIAELGVKIYMVGCEPSIDAYKEFFMALCHLTGGQYVPLQSARTLAKVIVGGAQEELSLQKMIEEVNAEILAEARAHSGELDTDELTTRIHCQLQQKNYTSKQLQMNNASLPQASKRAKKWSHYSCMDDVRKEYKSSESPQRFHAAPRMSRAPASRSPASRAPPAQASGGGIMSWVGSMFGGKNAATSVPEVGSSMGPAPDMLDGDLFGDEISALAPRPMSAVSSGDSYAVDEGEVDRNQAERLVQQAIMTNHLGARQKKH